MGPSLGPEALASQMAKLRFQAEASQGTHAATWPLFGAESTEGTEEARYIGLSKIRVFSEAQGPWTKRMGILFWFVEV